MNRKINRLILLVLLVIILSACSKNNNQQNDSSNQNNPVIEQDNETEVKLSDELVEIDKDSKLSKMFDTLNKYGKEIYDKNEYTKYNIKNNMYFASLNDLSDKYDVSIFVNEDGTVCDKDNSGIYFKINTKLDYNNNDNELSIIPILIGCSQEEVRK